MTAHKFVAATVAALLIGGALPADAAPKVPDYTTAEAGNPFADGWYADPDIAVYEGRYWVYPTSSRPYEEQTYLDAFSSTDLVNWTKHPNILTTADVSWATKAVWAPAPIQRNGKYYLYFAANDIQGNDELGGIGVAVADRPEGPYADAIGRPLIGQFHNGAQPIDQDVFIDDDGQAYMYYGGWGHANVVRLNADMTSLGQFDDGTTYHEITPENYVEGSQMFKRNGKYYLMWSEGGWTGPNYAVAYAMADSPTGPFTRIDKVLSQDPAVARGSGHNSVLTIPGTDIWYIFYHRRPLSRTGANDRQISYDRMYFNPDGTIAPVTMLVQDNFDDRNAIGWTTAGGTWSARHGRYDSTSGKALLDTNFSDFVQEANITLRSGRGDAGILFRVTGTDAGYYAGVTRSGRVLLSKAGTPLASAAIKPGARHELQVEAIGETITVYVDGTREITVTDASYASGANGVRAANTAAGFDDFAVTHR